MEDLIEVMGRLGASGARSDVSPHRNGMLRRDKVRTRSRGELAYMEAWMGMRYRVKIQVLADGRSAKKIRSQPCMRFCEAGLMPATRACER
jgi:hypothetical protein